MLLLMLFLCQLCCYDSNWITKYLIVVALFKSAKYVLRRGILRILTITEKMSE